MAYTIVNKSRQLIPVIVSENGSEKFVHLQMSGEGSQVTTDRITSQLQNLIDKRLVIAVDEEAKVTAENPGIPPVVQNMEVAPQDPQEAPKQDDPEESKPKEVAKDSSKDEKPKRERG